MNPPYALILGSGTSSGVPILGKTYPEAFLADPKNHRTRSSCLLAGPTGNLLVDCTPDMRTQLLREQVADIESVLITHTHADHIMGMDDLRAFCLKYQRNVDVYTLPVHQEDIRRVFPYAFREFPPGIFVPRFTLHDAPEVLEVGGLRVRLFTVPHGPTPCLALRVNNFAYITDVSEIPPPVMDLLTGLDTLILDAVRFKPHPYHFHFERAIAVAEQIGARQTFLTHLADDYDHTAFNATLPAHIQLAHDGLRIPL